jgi:hypothetical protein
MSEIKFCLQLNIYLVEISYFMNGGDFSDFNSITVPDRTFAMWETTVFQKMCRTLKYVSFVSRNFSKISVK